MFTVKYLVDHTGGVMVMVRTWHLFGYPIWQRVDRVD